MHLCWENCKKNISQFYKVCHLEFNMHEKLQIKVFFASSYTSLTDAFIEKKGFVRSHRNTKPLNHCHLTNSWVIKIVTYRELFDVNIGSGSMTAATTAGGCRCAWLVMTNWFVEDVGLLLHNQILSLMKENVWKKLEEFSFSIASLQRFLSSTISRQVAQFEKIMGNLDIFES